MHIGISNGAKKIGQIVDKIFQTEVTLIQYVQAFLAVMVIRLFIEQFIARGPKFSIFEVAVEFTHNILFFGVAFVFIWLFLSRILAVNPKKLAGLFVWSLILVIFPPILDILRTGGGVYWSFYILSDPETLGRQFLTFFGHLPTGIVYFGTKIVFILAIFLLSAFVFQKTKNFWKTILAFFGVYLILFSLGAFPTLVYYIWALISGKALMEIKPFEIAQFFGSPTPIWGLSYPSFGFAFAFKAGLILYPVLIFCLFCLFWAADREKLWAIIKNARFPQLIYHSGLLFIGMGLAVLDHGNLSVNIFAVFSALTLLLGAWLAWTASVFVNDLNDIVIDEVTNPKRPLQTGVFSHDSYRQTGLVIFLLSLLAGITLGPVYISLLFVYQALAWVYSSRPFRLKKYPLVASFISASASLTVLFLGYILVSPDQTILSLSSRIIFLLLVSYTLSIPVKDFKDIAGDKKDGVLTIPVVLGEEKGRIAVGVGLFISFILSVFFLNEFALFWWAMIFGAATFAIVNSKKIDPRRLPWWVLGLVFVYGLILTRIVFF